MDTINFQQRAGERLGCLRRGGAHMIGNVPTTEDRIRAVAKGDFESVGVVPDLQNGAVGGSGLDAETCQLVQIAALVAIDGPHVSWLRHLEAADEQEIELEKIIQYIQQELAAAGDRAGEDLWHAPCSGTGRR